MYKVQYENFITASLHTALHTALLLLNINRWVCLAAYCQP